MRVSKKYPVDLAKYGGKTVAPIFGKFNNKQLGISKSYFYKLKKKIENGEKVNSPSINKKLNKKAVNAIEITANKTIKKFNLKNEIKALKKQKSIIYKGSDNKLKRKEPKYIWVKFEIFGKGNTYWQSALLPKERISELEDFINDYIELNIKKYDKNSVYILQIIIQNV